MPPYSTCCRPGSPSAHGSLLPCAGSLIMLKSLDVSVRFAVKASHAGPQHALRAPFQRCICFAKRVLRSPGTFKAWSGSDIEYMLYCCLSVYKATRHVTHTHGAAGSIQDRGGTGRGSAGASVCFSTATPFPSAAAKGAAWHAPQMHPSRCLESKFEAPVLTCSAFKAKQGVGARECASWAAVSAGCIPPCAWKACCGRQGPSHRHDLLSAHLKYCFR